MNDTVDELGLARWLLKRIPKHTGDPQLRDIRLRADVAVWRLTNSSDKFFRSGNPVLLSEAVKLYRPDLYAAWRVAWRMTQ